MTLGSILEARFIARTSTKETAKELQAEMQDSLDRIEKSYKKVFPNGYFNIGITGSFDKPYMYIKFGLIDNINDVANKIRQNDPMYSSMIGHDISPTEKFTIEMLQAGLSLNPKAGSYLAMDRVKTSMRKSSGTIEKLEKTLATYFKKLGGIVKDNQDNIYGDVNPKYLL